MVPLVPAVCSAHGGARLSTSLGGGMSSRRYPYVLFLSLFFLVGGGCASVPKSQIRFDLHQGAQMRKVIERTSCVRDSHGALWCKKVAAVEYVVPGVQSTRPSLCSQPQLKGVAPRKRQIKTCLR